jgi:predicted AlkP superfamily phosphohydrolase/phosphomutase
MTVPEVNRSNKRVLFIGLDAGDAALIEQWCREGLLPNISQMKSAGMWAHMRTTAEIVHVSAWPSIFTGTTPDKHGLYHAYVTRPGHQGPMRPRPDQSPFPFLWKLLSDQGLRCVIMDAFMTCPLQNFNGTQIVEWGTWSWFSEPTVSPRPLKKEIHEKFGPYPAEDHSKVLTPPDCQGFRQRLLAAVTKKTQVVKWLMEREAWDLFLVVFGETHPAGHYFWHLHDPSYMAHPKGGSGALQHALRDVYVAIDGALGEILKSVDNQTTVFLVSGDGMGPNYSGSHILDALLTQMGLLKLNTANGSPSDDEPTSMVLSAKAGTDYLHSIRKLIPASIRVAISRALLSRETKERLSIRWLTAGIEWHRTRAFLLSNANEGFLRINLKGREPQGIVEPGREYQELCDELYQTVKGMYNPANGRLAARTIYKTDDIYSGCCRSHMPDIIINWNIDAQVKTQLQTAKYGLVQSDTPAFAVGPYYTGNHCPNAFMAVVGPEIPRGEVVEGANILDLAPTILSHLGVEPPNYMDGRVISELNGFRMVRGLSSERTR